MAAHCSCSCTTPATTEKHKTRRPSYFLFHLITSSLCWNCDLKHRQIHSLKRIHRHHCLAVSHTYTNPSGCWLPLFTSRQPSPSRTRLQDEHQHHWHGSTRRENKTSWTREGASRSAPLPIPYPRLDQKFAELLLGDGRVGWVFNQLALASGGKQTNETGLSVGPGSDHPVGPADATKKLTV